MRWEQTVTLSGIWVKDHQQTLAILKSGKNYQAGQLLVV